MTLPADQLLAGPAAPPECAAALGEIRTAGFEVPNVIDGHEVLSG
jgi:hypothetical protein